MGDILSRITRIAHRLGSKLLLALALSFVLTLIAGICLGRHWSAPRGTDPKIVERMQSKLSATDAALKAARGDLEMQRTRHEVDRHALELLRSEMAAEKVRTAELEEGLSFYRSMVVSDETAKGLSLRTPELVPGDNPSRVRYRIFVQQKDREYNMVEGRLMVEVVGVSGDREVTYPLAKLSKEFNDKSATLQFRYFQSIEGEINLPDGFEPKEIKLTARASKPREMAVKEQFPWTLQERFINVGE
jgi:hypothetical protein